MHCIFAGARGLFLDRLMRDTSAEVVVPEPGRLRLLGRAEPVVMAQSRVQQFVALFQVSGFTARWLVGRRFLLGARRGGFVYVINPALARRTRLVLLKLSFVTHPGKAESAEREGARREAGVQVLCGGKG